MGLALSGGHFRLDETHLLRIRQVSREGDMRANPGVESWHLLQIEVLRAFVGISVLVAVL